MPKIPEKLQPWIEARKKYRLTHEQIQMARELGMKPSGLDEAILYALCGKQSLSQYIGDCYRKRFKKAHPDDVRSIEERVVTKKIRQTLKEEKQAGIAGVATRFWLRFKEYFVRLKFKEKTNADHTQVPAAETAGQKKKSPREAPPKTIRVAPKFEEEMIAKFWTSITGLK